MLQMTVSFGTVFCFMMKVARKHINCKPIYGDFKMTLEEQYISEVEKLRTPDNGPVVEGIVDAFRACVAECASERRKAAMEVLDSAGAGMDKAVHFESLASLVLECDDRETAFRGLQEYRRHMLEG